MTASTTSTNARGEPAVVFHFFCGIERPTLTGFMHRSFVVVYDEPFELGDTPTNAAEIHPIDPQSLSAIKLFTFRGHGVPREVRIRSVYPEFFTDSRFLVFAFFADPLRSAANAYAWYLRQPGEGTKETFEEFLLRRPPNLYADAMGCNRWNWKRVLRRYFFKGVVERTEESVLRLAQKLDEAFAKYPPTPNAGRARYFMKRYFKSPDPDAGGEPELEEMMSALDSAAAAGFRQRNRLDYRIYEQVCSDLARDRATGRSGASGEIQAV